MEEFVTPEVEEVVAGFFRGLTCPQGILPRFTEVVSHTLLEKKFEPEEPDLCCQILIM